MEQCQDMLDCTTGRSVAQLVTIVLLLSRLSAVIQSIVFVKVVV